LRILWWDGHGMCMFTKRLEGGLFAWPQTKDGVASITAAQLAMLLDGLDWRFTREARTPQLAG
jgi:transposase